MNRRDWNKASPDYTEIKTISKVTLAEATIAWFYSGKKQPLISVETRHPVQADGGFDCTQQLQQAIDVASSTVYLPPGSYGYKPQ